MKSIAQIAAELQGYDPQALSADALNAFLERLVEPVTQTERVPLFSALGRVLAEDIVSPLSVPPHDNSAMDGFAFDGAQLLPGQPLSLNVVGTALAGAAFSRLESGVALRKGEPELLEAINQALDKLRADGTLSTLSTKYFGADVTQ